MGFTIEGGGSLFTGDDGRECIRVLEKTRKVGAGFGDGGREGSQFRHK